MEKPGFSKKPGFLASARINYLDAFCFADDFDGSQTQQQIGVLFIITQQLQPASIMQVTQSQQAWIISQQWLSPLVQVMQTPCSIISHLHMPMVPRL